MASRQTKKTTVEDRFFAVISYISFLCVVSLALKKKDKFVLYHAKIGLVLFVFEVAVFLLSIISILSWLKVAGLILFALISLWGIIQAILGKCYRLPVISNIADKVTI